MIFPSVNDLIPDTKNRYKLVVKIAKRARQLVDGSVRLSSVPSQKEVVVAMNEIYENKIRHKNIEEEE